jgi:hypothetical protein
MVTATKVSHEAFYFAATAGVIWLLWWVWQKNNLPAAIPAATSPSQQAFPIPWGSPMDNVYAADPTAYDPPSNADLTLNINNPYASMLDSAYMPLFGFVGIAQGVST